MKLGLEGLMCDKPFLLLRDGWPFVGTRWSQKSQPVLLMAGVQVGREDGRDQPVFLRDKCANFPLSLDDHFDGDRLHTAGRKPACDFFPQQRADLIADDAVENAPGLLGIDFVLVDLARRGKGLLYRCFA